MFSFEINGKLKSLTLRLSELEARQARMEKVLARQRRVNNAFVGLLECEAWGEVQRAIDEVQAIE